MSFSENKTILATLVAICLSAAVGAQNRPLYNQYQYNGVAINPAFAGSREVMSLAAFYRAQWLKTEGAPTTATLSGDFLLRNPNIALGLLFMNDNIGVYKQTSLYAVYAYRVRMGKGKLSLGLQGGFDFMGEDFSKVSTLEPNDPMFSKGRNRIFMPNVGVGVYYYTKRLFAGLSLPYLMDYNPSSGDSYKAKLALKDLMLYGGYIIRLSEAFKVKPAVLLRYNPDKMLVDANLNFLILPEDRIEVGMTYRSAGVWAAMAAVRVNQQIFIGYAYDHALGTANFTTGSHEIVLRYEFRYRVKAENPLFLR